MLGGPRSNNLDFDGDPPDHAPDPGNFFKGFFIYSTISIDCCMQREAPIIYINVKNLAV